MEKAVGLLILELWPNSDRERSLKQKQRRRDFSARSKLKPPGQTYEIPPGDEIQAAVGISEPIPILLRLVDHANTLRRNDSFCPLLLYPPILGMRWRELCPSNLIETAPATEFTEPQQAFIKWFEEIGIEDVPLVGGKNASLGEMYREIAPKSVRVPYGFAITAEAYRHFLRENGLDAQIKEILHDLNIRDLQNLRECGSKIRHAILAAKIPLVLEAEIIQAYDNLPGTEIFPPDVAVRSSATAEDLPSASFAGQQETYLPTKNELTLVPCVGVLGDCDPTVIRSNFTKIEWPPKSGKEFEIPEIDRAEFFSIPNAIQKINPAQIAFLESLEKFALENIN